MSRRSFARRAVAPFVRALVMAGVRPEVIGKTLFRAPRFVRELEEFRSRSTRASLTPRLEDLVPILNERDAPAGEIGGDYFWQDLWAARRIFERRPISHVDIGSRIDGFIAHLLVFMPVTVIDIRAMRSTVPGLSFVQEDATEMRSIADASVDSLSSLHAVEHFGLGRYGDPLDPDACFKMMRSLRRVLRPGGRLYFSVPIGEERVEFNAQRVFDPLTIIHEMGGLELLEFSAVDGNGRMHADADPHDFRSARYGCGLFEFTKPG